MKTKYEIAWQLSKHKISQFSAHQFYTHMIYDKNKLTHDHGGHRHQGPVCDCR